MGDMFRQVGNAVPPVMARAVGRVIHMQLAQFDESFSRIARQPRMAAHSFCPSSSASNLYQ
jgi:hypothetical protein